jgi:hypothetical protein
MAADHWAMVASEARLSREIVATIVTGKPASTNLRTPFSDDLNDPGQVSEVIVEGFVTIHADVNATTSPRQVETSRAFVKVAFVQSTVSSPESRDATSSTSLKPL